MIASAKTRAAIGPNSGIDVELVPFVSPESWNIAELTLACWSPCCTWIVYDPFSNQRLPAVLTFLVKSPLMSGVA